MEFRIKKIDSLSDKEFILIKELFEKHVLANANLESDQRIDEAILSERLGLKETDIVIFEEKKVEITLFTEENAELDFSSVLRMANQISSASLFNLSQKYINVIGDPYTAK